MCVFVYVCVQVCECMCVCVCMCESLPFYQVIHRQWFSSFYNLLPKILEIKKISTGAEKSRSSHIQVAS